MEERDNKSNTMLLTIIAIATLLVAVIGATFAYFTAQITGQETASTIKVTGSNLTITFADGNGSVVTTEQDIVPTKAEAGSFAPIITKNFTLTGTNTTGQGTTAANSGMKMPYELYLIVNTNTFGLQHTYNAGEANEKTETALTYKLVSAAGNAEGSVPSSTDTANIPAKTLETRELPTDSDPKQTSAIGNVTTYNSSGAVVLNNVSGLHIGNGYFAAGANGATHSYTLYIYFNETGKNQDLDKGKEFNGYVTVSAGDPGTAVTATYTAKNCANVAC